MNSPLKTTATETNPIAGRGFEARRRSTGKGVSKSPHCDRRATALQAAALSVGLITLPTPLTAGKLDDTRAAVRERGEDRHDSGDEKRRNDSDDDDDDDTVIILACLIPFITPFCIAKLVADNKSASQTHDGGPDRIAYFLPHPYAFDHGGRLVVDDSDLWAEAPRQPASDSEITFSDAGTHSLRARKPVHLSRAAGRVLAGYRYDWDTVHIPHLSINLDTASRVGFRTDWQLYLEPTENEIDKMVRGDLYLTFRIVNRTKLEMHVGTGGQILTDGQTDGGFSALLDATYFPVKPLVFGLDLKAGNINRAFVTSGSVRVGAVWGHFQPSIGYEFEVFSGNETAVVFHGPTAGITAWF